MVIFSPWAFGTTEPWSIWTMNISAYALGILLVTKWITRLATKYNPNPEPDKNELSLKQNRLRLIQKTCTILLAGSMFLLLAYILTSAINARASFNFDTKEYTYFDGVNNLPHSYDARGTWDWFTGAKTIKYSMSFNPRLKRLLFILCLNGGVLALECILQRVYFGEHSGKLLFLIEPGINSGNVAQFGPFAYRSNAASYLNMIWPLGLGLLIELGRENPRLRKTTHWQRPGALLIPCIILAASSPIISSTRGGALVMIGILILIAVSMLFVKVRSKFLRFCVLTALFAGFGVAFQLGWEKIEPRLINIFSDNMSSRTLIYETTLKMIDDYGKFGSGPGSFETIIQFELGSILSEWESWVHNDYLEFYLTFGKAGGVLMCCIVFLLAASYSDPVFQTTKDIDLV